MATLRVGLTGSQIKSVQGCLVFHDRSPIVDIVVNGTKHSLVDLIKEKFGDDQLDLFVINTTLTRERVNANSSSHSVPT